MASCSAVLAGGDERDQPGAGEVIAGVLMIILAPIAAALIQLAVWRSREFEADLTGAEVWGDPMAQSGRLGSLLGDDCDAVCRKKQPVRAYPFA